VQTDQTVAMTCVHQMLDELGIDPREVSYVEIFPWGITVERYRLGPDGEFLKGTEQPIPGVQTYKTHFPARLN
jgi:hypothetical protein